MTKMQIQEFLTRGIADVVVRAEVEQKLAGQTPLTLKLGIDPTGAQLHIGHAVVLRKLRTLQDNGHNVVIIVGDYTAKIGDPTGRDKMREPLTDAQVEEHLATFERQALRILDASKTSFRYQSEWFDTFNLKQIMELAGLFTVQQLIERDMFQKRLDNQQAIGLHEFLYPLLQGYDSVAIESDIEFGGSDQLFNNLAGRPIQQANGQEPQNVIVTQLLEGLDGRKMSKTYQNFVAIETEPKEMYGKLMTLNDDLIVRYFEVATDIPMQEVEEIRITLEKGENPKQLKMRLAREIVTIFHSAKEANEAEEAFIRIFQHKETPTEMESIQFSEDELPLIDVLVQSKLSSSKSEARRVIEQGGVRINEEVIQDTEASVDISLEPVIRVGKRHFRQIRHI